ncbi:MAG: type II secretion system F family protein, partial [Mycobacterium sp.]
MSAAATLLAAALLTGARPSTVRARAGMPARAHWTPRRPVRAPDPLAVASSLDVLAVCLAAGMAVATAAAAT